MAEIFDWKSETPAHYPSFAFHNRKTAAPKDYGLSLYGISAVFDLFLDKLARFNKLVGDQLH